MLHASQGFGVQRRWGGLVVGLAVLSAGCAVGREPPAPTPMVRIAAGEFAFGPELPCYHDGDNPCTAADGSMQRLELANPYPTVRVSLPEFYLDAFEVTNAQYAYCVAMGRCKEPIAVNAPNLKTQGDYYNDPQFANYPVVQVTWQMAQDYCAFVGRRLPTELEWERAAKGLRSWALGPKESGGSDGKHEGRIYPVDGMAFASDHDDCLTLGLPTTFCAPGGSNEVRSEPQVDAEGNITASTNDFVTERDAQGNVLGKIYYLFGNVSEWTADAWREHPSCSGPAPCASCWDCDAGDTACESLCATCTTCSDGGCHYACGNDPEDPNTLETVVCSAYAEQAQPISPATIAAQPVDDPAIRVIRGGNVTDGPGWGCLARSAGRDRVRTNPAYVPTTGFPEVGFRCAADAPPTGN